MVSLAGEGDAVPLKIVGSHGTVVEIWRMRIEVADVAGAGFAFVVDGVEMQSMMRGQDIEIEPDED